MKCAFEFFCFHWRKFAWSGTGTALATLGTQLENKTYVQWCYIAACVCAILAANDRPEERQEREEEDQQ